MDALISAKAGLAIFIHGDEADVVSVNDTGAETRYPASSIRFLLAGATDVKKITSLSKKQSLSILEKEYKKSRALSLTLIALDQLEEDETVALSIECLTDLCCDVDVFNYIENTLYFNILPETTNLVRVKKLLNADLCKLITEVESFQEGISRYRSQWDLLPDEIFNGSVDKLIFEEVIVTSGIFKQFVKAGDDSNKHALAKIECLDTLKKFKNSRGIINLWLSGTNVSKSKTEYANFDYSADTYSHKEPTKRTTKPKISPHDAFLNAIKQKNAIIPLLKKGQWSKTRRYVEDLIKSQYANSDPEHISKSLCDLAQHAKTTHNYSLQLELAKRATEIAADDGWAYSQVAEAYICLCQYDLAITSLKTAEVYGQSEYAQIGYARILRAQGKYDEAIDFFKKLIVDFPDSSVVLNCYAEVLKDIWKLEDALSVYETSIQRNPYESTSYCGKASILKVLGRFDEALETYNQAKQLSNDSEYIGSGIADILKHKGDYNQAITMYDEVIKKFPESATPRCGRATVFKIMGEYSTALKEFKAIANEFPFDITPKEGEAETLKESGKLPEALVKFNDILKDFPLAPRSRNGRANVLKLLGEYEKSLQAYDENVRDFPYDLIAWNGRADLLKQLGYLNESVEAYDSIARLNPLEKGAIYSKAAIYVVMGRYSEALKLLPTAPPQTRDDWFAHHIKGMTYLLSGRVNEAVELFKEAVMAVPSYNLQKYFKSALAVASLRLKTSTTMLLGAENHNDYLSNVLNIHAYGELQDYEKAEQAYIKIEKQCPPFVITLRDELAARYLKSIKPLKPQQHDLDWIFAEECKVILLDAA